MQIDNKEGGGDSTLITSQDPTSRGSVSWVFESRGKHWGSLKRLMFLQYILFRDPNEEKVGLNLHLFMKVKIPLKF